jgi:hypothetical protein
MLAPQTVTHAVNKFLLKLPVTFKSSLDLFFPNFPIFCFYRILFAFDLCPLTFQFHLDKKIELISQLADTWKRSAASGQQHVSFSQNQNLKKDHETKFPEFVKATCHLPCNILPFFSSKIHGLDQRKVKYRPRGEKSNFQTKDFVHKRGSPSLVLGGPSETPPLPILYPDLKNFHAEALL